VRKLGYVSLAVGLLALGFVGGVLLLARQPETTPAIRGKRLAEAWGCFACHGPEGSGGVGDRASPGGTVPDWQFATVAMFARSEDDLREWILYGVSRRQAERADNDDRRPLAPMPAYERDLTARQLEDLVAYVLAVSGWRPEIPDRAFEGRKLAQRLGCFGCHGPSGMGGVANPGSLKGQIPPWDGDEFTKLVRDEQELREWILEGTLQRLQDNAAARYFLDRQKTRMPAYHDHISDAELNLLVDYIQWLRQGPASDGQEQRKAATVIGSIGP
jgi:mono/diheme cytochrome c family protein